MGDKLLAGKYGSKWLNTSKYKYLIYINKLEGEASVYKDNSRVNDILVKTPKLFVPFSSGSTWERTM